MKPLNTPKDFLTNCYTREGILPFLKHMEEAYLADKKPFTVLIMDVDHFKSFNDKYGHLLGDEVLKYFSSSMRLDLEDEENAPFRFGGDEFIMVFPNKTPAEAYHLASRFRKNIRTRSCLVKGRQIGVTFSGGIAGYPENASSIEDILDKADKALYYSKNHGRGRITKFSELNKKELLQVTAIVLVLGGLGWTLYTFRDSLAERVADLEAVLSRVPLVSRWLAPKSEEAPAPVETPVPEAPPVETPPPAPAPPAEAVEPAAEPEPVSRIYLETGRIVTGVIKNEGEDTLRVEVALKEGQGTLQIKKSQVTRIETEKQPPRDLR